MRAVATLYPVSEVAGVLPKEIADRIIEALKPVDPYRVILFGSYAWGAPGENSDIDLLVVTKEPHIPANFNERRRTYLKVSSALRELQRDVPIDLIIHTRPVYEKFVEVDSIFSRKIHHEGVRLI